MTLTKFEDRFPTFFDDFFEDRFMKPDFKFLPKNFFRMPAVNIRERELEFQIDFAVPGMKKEDFKIKLEGNMLTVSSDKEFEKEEKDENFTRREFGFSEFSRSFNLPEYVKMEDIKAMYEEGVLKLFIPKKEEAKVKPFKEIKIS